MATYQITDGTARHTSPVMSAFPRHTRPFTEPVSATSDVVIGPGKTLPELIRKFYPSAIPEGFRANYGFLDRDNKERAYDPARTDPFVFKGMGSLKHFSESAHGLMAVLNTLWTNIGLPLIKDKDRGIDVPDTEVAWKALSKEHPLHSVVTANRNDIYFIIANADIMKKACVVRTVSAGWWAVSYAGKNAPDKKYFQKSLNAHKRAVAFILQSSNGKALYNKLWASASDPLDTNPGYPFFSVQLDPDGNPVTRIKTVELFKNIGLEKSSWDSLLDKVDSKAGQFGLPGHPFAVAPIRRLQPGYKWQHQFTSTPAGLVTSYDEQGVNSQRVAHMVPYAYNVLTAPMSTAYKTVRTLLPGTYHDGPSKTKRMKVLRKLQDQNRLWLAEADYKNFDRFMAVDLIEEIVSWFTSISGNPGYWHPAMMYLHRDASLIWPDFSTVNDGIGWVFKPGALGLLSGVKATSETGTLVNSVVNGEALARTMDWTEEELYKYLISNVSSEPSPAQYEHYYVQSDDTQLIQSDPETLLRHGNHFMEAVAAAGLKGSIELADRFLMRHLQNGRDAPVPARVWQNTLSNESPPESDIIFLAGLASRTDGLCGVKTVDAFDTGKTQRISKSEAVFTKAMLHSLLSFATTAAKPVALGIKLLTLLHDAIPSDPERQGWTPGGTLLVSTSEIRTYINKLLSKSQLLDPSPLGATAKWIAQLVRDKNVPSSAIMLDELISASPEVQSLVNRLTAKDEAFFKYAASTIGVQKLSVFS